MGEAGIALELRRLAAVIAALGEDVRHLERRPLAADDRRIVTVLLPLAAELIGEEWFTVPLLLQSALEDRTSLGQALREVLNDYGSIRAVGRLLARLDGVTLGGCRLTPAGERRDGRAWRVVRVSDD